MAKLGTREMVEQTFRQWLMGHRRDGVGITDYVPSSLSVDRRIHAAHWAVSARVRAHGAWVRIGAWVECGRTLSDEWRVRADSVRAVEDEVRA